MKNNTLKIVLLAFALLLIGSVIGWQGKTYSDRRNDPVSQVLRDSDSFYRDFFNEDFFRNSKNPFAEMERMQSGIFRQFGDVAPGSNSFENWFKEKFGGGAPSDFKQREDADYVYYEIDLKDQRPQKVDVKVKDGQVSIYASSDENVVQGNTRKYASSEYVRSLPIPDNVDADRFVVSQDQKEIVIKFPKVK